MTKRRRYFTIAVVLFTLLGVGSCVTLWLRREPGPESMPTQPPEGEGWLDLLDEDHAPHWENITDGKDIFEITEDRELHIYGRSLFPLRYVGYAEQPFSDFDLHLEFRLTPGANSGVFVRVDPEDPVHRGWEIQVLEDYGERPGKNGCGAIYDVVTPMFNMSRPPREWNSFDISVDGGQVQVKMNGWLVVHTDLDRMTMPIGKFDVPMAELPREGLLALQDHGGEVWYRNIRVRPKE